MLGQGDKRVMVHRRLFEKDPSRFFVGEVQKYEAGIAKVTGYSFVKDVCSGNFCRKSEYRPKILAIASGTLMVYQLPGTVIVDSSRFTLDQDGGLVLGDDGVFDMDASETIHKQNSHSSKL